MNSAIDLSQVKKGFAPFAIDGLSEDVYHEDRLFESNSSLKNMLRSPAHYRFERDNPQPDKACFKLGRAIHCAILEPMRFKSDYVVSPEYNLRTKDGRTERDAFYSDAAADGKKVVTEADLDMIYGASKNIQKHKKALKILTQGRNEVSFFWSDPVTGLWMKCRTDTISEFGVFDVKSTEDASPEGFKRACRKFRYDMQASIYSSGTLEVTKNPLSFGFIAIEKKPPYAIALYIAPNEMIASGYVKYQDAATKVLECRKSGVWGGYQPDSRYDVLDWGYFD